MTEPKRKPKDGLTEILIVEDSPTQAARLEHILQQAGYRVAAASNGKEALAGIGRRKPTLVISDILMPEMDGYELCKRLKADASLSAIPVILLTTLSDPTDVVKGLECGADYFITKPYDEKMLVSRVNAVLSNLELRKTQKMGVGISISIAGQKYFITSDRMQILDFLISTYETAVQQNRELTETRDKLNDLNEKLDEKVKQRTSELIAEVAQRIKAEESIARLNSVLRALRNVNQLITKENDRDKLLKGACDTMTDTRGYRSAWIALFDSAGKLLFTIESGLGKAFQPVLEQLQHGELTKCGPHALNQPGLSIKDPSTDCGDCPLAKTSGEKMVVVARLKHGTKTYGMLAVSLPIDVPPDMDEQSLFQELVDDIAFGLHKIELEEQRKQAEHELQERYKELSCLYNVSSLAALPDIPFNELLKRIIMLLPPAWQFPEVTEARIVLERQAFQTARFRETPWMLVSKIIVSGKTVGQLEACYLEERPASDEGPFLKEEKQLINSIALHVGQIYSRIRSEQALKESEEQLRMSMENAPDGIFMFDLEANFIYGNRMCEEIIGYKREYLIGKNFLELNILTENSLAVAAGLLQMSGMGKPTSTDELVLIRKDGQLVPVEINTTMVQRGGQPVVLAFVRDITERKQSEEKLVKSYESLKKTLSDSINTMVKIVETRDPYTAGHQQKVADLATAIARAMKLEESRIDQLRMAAITHDIGKIHIPSDILSKPGQLSDIEFSLIKTHAQAGYDIVKGMDFPGIVAQAVLQHHERMDGSGYPNQLKGEDTLLEAKILAVADVIEAMSSNRPYRPALGIDKALEEISKNKGRLYDPDVVDTSLELFNSGKFEFKYV